MCCFLCSFLHRCTVVEYSHAVVVVVTVVVIIQRKRGGAREREVGRQRGGEGQRGARQFHTLRLHTLRISQ